VELHLGGSQQAPVAGSRGNDNKPPVSIKGGEFLYFLSKYSLLMKDSGPWNQLNLSTSETSLSIYQTTRPNTPEDSHLHTGVFHNKSFSMLDSTHEICAGEL
jgi:hypothetical protein